MLLLAGMVAALVGLLKWDRTLPGSAMAAWPLMLVMAGGAVVVAVLIITGIGRYRAYQQMRNYLQALESLQQVSAAISARIGQGPVVLQQVTDAARHLLRMSMACVLIKENEYVKAITASGIDEPIVGRRWLLEDTRVISQALRQNRIVWISDTVAVPDQIHPEAIHLYNTRAFLAVPLEVEGRTLGALVIADHRPRHLREDELRLARLWAAHAAVILHNDALCQRMDAALRHERQVQAQRDLLVDLSSVLYERRPLQYALQRLSERAPEVLGVDLVCFALRLDNGAFEFVSATSRPGTEKLVGMRFAPGKLRCADSLQERRIICIENAWEDKGLNSDLMASLGIGSIMFVPMFGSDGVPLAVMSLSRYVTGPFTLQQQQIGTHLADRVAAAMEAVRLHNRIRNDAETKSMLLRELHHRVKNNLAGIVALLSINRPELPPSAQQWLDRAINRIGVMARAHELFTGASESRSLAEVVRITLSSLSVVAPMGVRIHPEVEADEIILGPDRAIALAMVLHELAHNALVHGTSASGAVTIRCAVEAGVIRIAVIDEGKDEECPGEEGPRRLSRLCVPSVGLTLVRGLVARELQGEFELGENEHGGTTARVAFPAKECDADRRNANVLDAGIIDLDLSKRPSEVGSA